MLLQLLQSSGCDTHWNSAPENTHRTDTDDFHVTVAPFAHEATFQLAFYTNKIMSEFMYQRIPIILVTDTDKLSTKQIDRQATYGCIHSTI